MFTGIVEELGTVEAGCEDQGDAVRLTVRGPLVTSDADLGDSISVNGCCLTVAATTDSDGESFTADVMHETLAKTSLGALRARRAGSTSSVRSRRPPGSAATSSRATSTAPARACGVRRASTGSSSRSPCPRELERYLVPKGSITVDGISLTVVDVDAGVVHGQPDPRDPRPHHAGLQATRRRRQPRGGRDREVRREDGEAVSETRAPDEGKIRLDTVEEAIADIAAGKAVVVVDDEDRENEGDIIFAASKATPELMAFTIRHSSGVICVPMPADMLDRLEIPLMTPHNKDKLRTAYTISVDARDGVTTGISAADRAHTARVLADSATEPWEVTRPGHVFPLRYREGGVLVRRGHTEAAVDLARMAGLTPAGVLVEVVNDDGTMKRGPDLREFADEHGLKMISIEQMVHYRRRTESHVAAGRRDACCPPATATSPRSATGSPSTAASTSPWCTATRRPSATASRC